MIPPNALFPLMSEFNVPLIAHVWAATLTFIMSDIIERPLTVHCTPCSIMWHMTEGPSVWQPVTGHCTPADILRNNTVVIKSKRRHFDVITSKWRRFDEITTLSLRHVFRGTLMWYYVPHNRGASSLTTTYSSLYTHVLLCDTWQRGLQSDSHL